jgi:hypothetical protein
VKTPEEMQAKLDKHGAVLLNGPGGRIIIHRARVEAVCEQVSDITQIHYKGADSDSFYNITDPFDEVIEKIYG